MNKEIDYVVIGAGMAGLSAGYQLKKQNKEFIILEKESSAGGRASTRNHENINFDLGAGFIMGSYKELFNIINDLNIEVVKQKNYASHLGIVYKGNIHGLNSNLNSLFRFDLVPLKEKIHAVIHLPVIVKDFVLSAWLNKATDENLNLYFNRTLSKNFVKYLIDPITNNLFFYNTDSLTKSLLYKLVNYVKSDTTYYSFPNGINEVSEKLANVLPVEFNSTITSIKRDNHKVEIVYTQNNETKILVANKVIVAIPGNQVKTLVHNQLPIEKEFFNGVEYTSTVKILCSTKLPVFDKYDRIYFVENENQKLVSVNLVDKVEEIYYFTVGINNELSQELLKNEKISLNALKKIIKENVAFIPDFEIHDVSKWKSALPKFNKHYIFSLNKFLTGQNLGRTENIFYAGDYLYGPFIEGAVNSGIAAVKDSLE